MTLRFGFTPCPNDAFAFHALAHGLVDAPFAVEPVLYDIEELNRRSAAGELELTKLSFGAAAAAGDRYRLLRRGARARRRSARCRARADAARGRLRRSDRRAGPRDDRFSPPAAGRSRSRG